MALLYEQIFLRPGMKNTKKLRGIGLERPWIQRSLANRSE
jgi:hypothetical protein